MRFLVPISIMTLALGSCSGDKMGAEKTGPGAVQEEGRASVRLYTLDCGHFEFSDMAPLDRNGAYDGQSGAGVDPCFLVRHPNGDLLWDAGIGDSVHGLHDGATAEGIHFTAPKTLKGQLADLGLSPADVEFLSLSHSHYDHAGNANEYASATWLVDEAERAYMFRDEARADALSFGLYSALEAAKTVTFTDDHDVFGDGSVVIVRTPGHTPGHTSLLVRLKNSGAVLLSGDLYHLAAARENRTVPVWNTDPDETLRSMDKFEALAKAEDARAVIQHEAADFAKLPAPPAYLD